MANESEFARYNWEGDEKWLVYKLNLIIPHKENSPQYAQALDKIKRKYYRRNVDPNFEATTTTTPTPSVTPTSSPSDFSQGPMKFPDVKPTFEAPSQPKSSSSPPSSSYSDPSASSSSRIPSSSSPSSSSRSVPQPQSSSQSSSNPWSDFLSNFAQTVATSSPVKFLRAKATPLLPRVWFAANIMLLLNSLFYCFWGAAYYYSALSAASLVFLSSLCMSVHFTPDSHFLRRVYSSENFSFLVLCLVFDFLYQPVIAILIMLFIQSLFHTFDFVMQQRMVSHPYAFSAYQKLNSYRSSLLQSCGSLKWAASIQLVIDLVMGRGSFFLCVGYFCFLFMDLYRSIPRGQLVPGLDNAVSHPSCPSFIRSNYRDNLRPYLLRALG